MAVYVPFEPSIKNINNIIEGDILYVVSDILEMLKIAKLKQDKIDLNVFIDSILEKVGSHGTVLFPTFNWDFCNGIPFDYKKSNSKTGALTQVALNRNDFKRTKHPLYSFAVWGKDKEKLCEMDDKKSFGEGTVFEYLHKNNAKALTIGISALAGLAYIHHIEKMVDVPYRYEKDFTGDYIDENGECIQKTYSMYVRNMDMDPKHINGFEPLVKIIEKLNVADKCVINNIDFTTVNLSMLYKIVEIDIRINDSRNMYYYKGQLPQKNI